MGYVAGQRFVEDASAWVAVARVNDAERGTGYVVRIKAQNISYRVICDGRCGTEVLSSGTIAAGAETIVRPAGLPSGVLAANDLLVQARQLAATTRFPVWAEIGWEDVRKC